MNEFKGLKQFEEVILSVQDHWILLLRPFLLLILGGSICTLIYFVNLFLLPYGELPTLFLYILFYIILILTIHTFFALLFQYIISNLIVTNKRIIEIKYLPFMIDDINHIEISKINEIKKIKHGVIENILNYGDVLISVSETQEVIRLAYIRRPNKFVNLIEAIKFETPLENLDLQGIGATMAKKYAFLKK